MAFFAVSLHVADQFAGLKVSGEPLSGKTEETAPQKPMADKPEVKESSKPVRLRMAFSEQVWQSSLSASVLFHATLTMYTKSNRKEIAKFRMAVKQFDLNIGEMNMLVCCIFALC